MDYRVASAGYFETMGVPLVSGRAFAASDTTTTPPVMIVNEVAARRFFPGGNPIGRRVRFSGPPETSPWREIVGVVADIRHDLNREPRPETYIPHTQANTGGLFLVAKTRDNAMGMAPSLRAAVLAIDPAQPVWAVRTLDDTKDRAMATFSAMTAFISAFGVVALLLAAIGIFGVVSFVVSTRTAEIGLRMALGATARDVMGMIVAHASRPLVAGFVLGGFGAFAVGRVLTSAFPEVATADPSALFATIAILAVVSGFAIWLPARRAAAIAPTEALRTE